MKLNPQMRLTLSLVMLLFSAALVGDTLGLLPRPDDQVRDARKVMGEALAVQLSSAASTGNSELIARTLESVVKRNKDVLYGQLARSGGDAVAEFGVRQTEGGKWLDFSTLDNIVVPIYGAKGAWGEVRLQFQPTNDWAQRYLGFPLTSLYFIAFLCGVCVLMFYLFLSKALKELNPTKAVPERVQSAFEVLAEGVVIIDEKQRIVMANKSFAQRLGTDPDELIGKSPNNYAWDLSGKEGEELPWQIALTDGERVMDMYLRLEINQQTIAFAVNAAPIQGHNSRNRGVLITFDDVSSLEEKNTELAAMLVELNETQKVIENKNEELEALATRDSLTGFYNRRSFMEFYSQHFSEARQRGTQLSVLMVDIDHFKAVNDNHGHLVGDQAIIVVANALGEFFRKNDCVGRYGGEEFVVSMPGASYQESFEAADQVREHIETLAKAKDLPMEKLTVSIGLATLDSQVANETLLIDMADRGLYKAKQTGRNQVCLFDPDYTAQPEKSHTAQPVDEKANDELREHLEKMKVRVREQAKELTYRTMHDDLTRLPNRFLLQDRIGQAVKQSQRSNTAGAVVSISLSAYQRIFDIDGHAAAEQLMLRAAEVLQGVMRSGDSVATVQEEEAVTCSRIAHNELAALVVDLDDVSLMAKIVSRITDALEEGIPVGDHEIFSLVYCGIALFPVDSENPEVLIRNATLARKFAKRRSGHRSGHAYFSKEIDAQAIKNAHIAAELNKVINEGGLNVVYQPKVDTFTHEVAGVEALARWHHEDLGSVSPDSFITIAEHIGVIHRLTNWVFRQVCRDIVSGVHGNMRVSVNLSPLELSDPNTAKRVLGILAEYNVPPSQIEVEVTESSFLHDFQLGQDILLELREAGVLIALDDFGTGFSSLNMLTQIPVDVIKIDRSFVSNIHQTKANHAIVQAILQMSRALGMRVVAEGVSNNDEYACMKLLGCLEMQGFHFAKPMPADELTEYNAKVGVRPRAFKQSGPAGFGVRNSFIEGS